MTTSLPRSPLSFSGVPSATISPGVDDRQPLAELVRLLEVLRGQEDRRPRLVDAADLLPDGQPGGGVESGGGLVEEEHLRPVHERAGEVQPPLHPAGVGLGAPVGGVGQPDQLEQLVGPVAPRRAMDPVQPALELEQLASGLHRVEADLLERDADAPPHLIAVVHHVVTCHRSGPRRRRQQGAEHPHDGRLAGAVRAQEAEDLALGHPEVDSAHGLDSALEGAGQVSRFDGRGFPVVRSQLASVLGFPVYDRTAGRNSSVAACSHSTRTS